MDLADVKMFWIWCLSAPEKYKIPSLCMAIDAFIAWAKTRFLQSGPKVAKHSLDGDIDWEWEHGCFNFVRDEDSGANDDTQVRSVICRRLSVVVALPEWCKIVVKEVGSLWTISANHVEEKATIVNTHSLVGVPLARLFSMDDSKVIA